MGEQVGPQRLGGAVPEVDGRDDVAWVGGRVTPVLAVPAGPKGRGPWPLRGAPGSPRGHPVEWWGAWAAIPGPGRAP